MILAIAWADLGNGYQVSNFGSIRNSSGKILKPWKHRSGHLYVSLGRTKRGQVHRFVMAAFGPPCLPGQECRHLDGDPENNRIDNLAWGTRKENVDDLKRVTGRYARSLLRSEMAAEIRSKFTGKHGQQSQLAREYGFSLSLVNRIVRGKTYAARN